MSSAQGHTSTPTPTEGPEGEHVEVVQQVQRRDPVEQHQERAAEPELEREPKNQSDPKPRQEAKPHQEPKPRQEPEPVTSSSYSQPPGQPPEAPQPEPQIQQDPKPRQMPEPRKDPKPRQEPEPVASPSYSRPPEQPPETPPKDRDLERRLSVDPTFFFSGSPQVDIIPLQVSSSSRFSQVLDWNPTGQPSLTAAAQLLSNETSNMTSARPLVNQPTAARNDGMDYNTNTNATGSTSNVSNRNTVTGGRNTTEANQEVVRPLSSFERRPTGPGLAPRDPIRSGNTFQAPYMPDPNDYDGGGDPASVPNRNAGRRGNVARPRSGPTDETMVGNGPGAWTGSRRASRLMSGQDWLHGVPVVEEPPVSGFFCPIVWEVLNVRHTETEDCRGQVKPHNKCCY